MYRFARLVKATFAWWDHVPTVLRRLAVVVVLQLLGLLPSVGEIMRLIG